MKKTILQASVAAALLASVPAAQAAVNTFNYDGFFTMLNGDGVALENPDALVAKGGNTFLSPITGTLSFDTVTGAGTGTLVPFAFQGATKVAAAVGIKMQAIGDGAGGPGSLVLGNMLFNWNANNGIPVSIVLDAAGFFGASQNAALFNPGGGDAVIDQADVAGFGAAPAADGTYINTTFGYAATGPVPMATTEWNTNNINGCAPASCMGNGSSGGLLPVLTDGSFLVADTQVNTREYSQGDGVGVGGSPFQDGPFAGFNPNFDVTTLTFTGQQDATIAANCTFVLGDPCAAVPNAVPVPAAVWLFGSGLLGLVGVARRKKAEV